MNGAGAARGRAIHGFRNAALRILSVSPLAFAAAHEAPNGHHHPQAEHLHFSRDEFAARRANTIAEMQRRGLRALLLFRQESTCMPG